MTQPLRALKAYSELKRVFTKTLFLHKKETLREGLGCSLTGEARTPRTIAGSLEGTGDCVLGKTDINPSRAFKVPEQSTRQRLKLNLTLQVKWHLCV